MISNFYGGVNSPSGSKAMAGCGCKCKCSHGSDQDTMYDTHEVYLVCGGVLISVPIF
jgi:hypothetical protein